VEFRFLGLTGAAQLKCNAGRLLTAANREDQMRIALLVPVAILLATSSLEAQSGSSATATGNVRGGLGAPPDAAPPANRLSGIYLGFRLPGFGPGSVAVGSVEAYAFYPDGTAMYLPVGGLEGYDLTQAAAGGLDPLTYGTYVYGDGKVRFTSRNGAAREIRIDPVGSGPGLAYVRACHCNGARFAGTYYYGLKAQTITFSADGRFVDQGAMHDAFQFSYPNNQRATAPGAGTYQVQDYTIHLNYSDGRQFRYSFIVASHPPKTPEAMWIRGVSFHPAPGSISNASSAEPDGSQILANGNPPLTELIARDFGAFFT
jgi:hypothetical protein